METIDEEQVKNGPIIKGGLGFHTHRGMDIRGRRKVNTESALGADCHTPL